MLAMACGAAAARRAAAASAERAKPREPERDRAAQPDPEIRARLSSYARSAGLKGSAAGHGGVVR